MIELHEQLSEFSYGYGITREMEQRLLKRGIRATPFLPSLIHEEKLGFDVGFSDQGRVMVLQFKLGQILQRFRKTHASQQIPKIDHPFWRFFVNTSDHQFQRLLALENQGAEVFYVAPRFSTWSEYDFAFRKMRVLDRSIKLTPREIWAGSKPIHGMHRVIYDKNSSFICSEPSAIEEIATEDILNKASIQITNSDTSLLEHLEEIYRRDSYLDINIPTLSRKTIHKIHSKAKTRGDELAALIGFETWLQGAQTLLLTPIVN